jgi:hypothetical protein
VFWGLSVMISSSFPIRLGRRHHPLQINCHPSQINPTGTLEKMNITNVMLWMMKNAYEQTTIKKVAKLLRHLERNSDTTNPEEVKLYIAKKECSNGHKQNLIEAYACFIHSSGLAWEQPFYQRYSKKRKAPKEELIDFLINQARIEMALKLSMSRDLGQRPKELTWLKLKDIDLSTGTYQSREQNTPLEEKDNSKPNP